MGVKVAKLASTILYRQVWQYDIFMRAIPQQGELKKKFIWAPRSTQPKMNGYQENSKWKVNTAGLTMLPTECRLPYTTKSADSKRPIRLVVWTRIPSPFLKKKKKSFLHTSLGVKKSPPFLTIYSLRHLAWKKVSTCFFNHAPNKSLSMEKSPSLLQPYNQ